MKNNLKKIPLLLALLLFLFLCFAGWFLYKEINNNNQKAQAGMVVWQTEAKRREDITTLDKSLREVAPLRANLDTHFAKSTDIVPFLDTIEALAPKAGATAEVSAVSAEADNTGLVVELKAKGSFESLYKFLTLLENSPYEMDFLSMDMHTTDAGAADKSATSSGWDGDFKIKLLSYVP